MLFFGAVISAVSASYSFRYKCSETDWLSWANHCLEQSYNTSADPKVKKVDLSVTEDAFIRLRKTYTKRKEEYFSFNLHRLEDMEYYGNTASGTLELKTVADDIIVQTRHDRHGDVDSMTTVLEIPVKNMEPERLDSLREAFNYFKQKNM